MPLYKNKYLVLTGLAMFLVFASLLSIRLGLFEKNIHKHSLSASAIALFEKDTWMNIFQNNNKIGFSHTIILKDDNGYEIKENVFMKINTMGLLHDIYVKTLGNLNPDFTLRTFAFEINSGRFAFAAKGETKKDILSIQTQSFGDKRKIDIPVKTKPYLMAGLVNAAFASGLKEGEVFTFNVFDPASMSQVPVLLKIVKKEDIQIGKINHKAFKTFLSFKGTTQILWVSDKGEILKEKGFLGISLEKTTKDDALNGMPVTASDDLTKLVSIPSNIILNNPEKLKFLKIQIKGVELDSVKINDDRQILKNGILHIKKESIEHLSKQYKVYVPDIASYYYIKPTPFIQSDNREIENIVKKTVNPDDPPIIKAKKLVSWINSNIEKRPVISLPDAVSTLKNKAGDCNEHAVLMAALSRAAGIPARVEAGLVYLNGGFYYHAWNSLYFGRWVAIDPLFGQIPADVTHIRFSTGGPKEQLDILSLLGKIKIKVIEFK
ncbi:MAG: transglutaminase-like domain-containing protein [Proteobacteria bacterium]|nr:transglutaminase-like domain-containing protein [Pseudomonadota bacterium]